MTSEVALLNKNAIALAADSATTVTYWDKNEPVTRYFKGANKVFNISSKHPVGIMTFATASLQGVPWDIVIKAYREYLGSKSHEHLAGYATDFFEFIAGNNLIFPLDVQEQQFAALADRAAANVIVPAHNSKRYKLAGDEAKRGQIITDAIQHHEDKIKSDEMVSGASRTDVDDALDKFTATVLKQLREDSYYSKVVPDDVMEKLARVAISRVFAASFSGRGVTGIVFAGYGEKEYFPKVEKYICHGLILGKPYFSKEDEICISHSNASDAMPLAQADMINTFISGASFKSMSDIHGIMLKQLEEIEKKLKADGHLNKDFSFDDIRATVEDSFRAQVVEYFYNTHRKPLQRVIASLPIDELAELAETLVYIESLKERVTSPSESVSGPIDVAVISKHDGFIWIKRKHYFKGELNPRFFVNRQRET